MIDLLDQADRAAAQVDDTTGEISDHLTTLQSALRDTSRTLHAETQKLRRTAGQIDRAVKTDQMENISDILGTDPTEVSTFLSAPVKLKTTKFYPVENYGFGDGTVLFGAFHLGRWYCVGSTMKVSLEEKRKRCWRMSRRHRSILADSFVLAHRSFSKRADPVEIYIFLRFSASIPFYFLLGGWFTSIVFVNMIYRLWYRLEISAGDLRRCWSFRWQARAARSRSEMTPDVFPKLYVLLPFAQQHGAARSGHRWILRKHLLGGAQESLLVSGSLLLLGLKAAQTDH